AHIRRAARATGGAGRIQRAGAEVAGDVASVAARGTRRVAAIAVDAETALALARARARLTVGLLCDALARGIAVIRARAVRAAGAVRGAGDGRAVAEIRRAARATGRAAGER